MSATQQRDHTCTLAKSQPTKAYHLARQISDPWFRAQALAWVARFIDDDPRPIATQAAQSSRECRDDYQRSAVRAWEAAALAERGFIPEARKVLRESLAVAKSAEPLPSRSEAIYLLLQAAFSIDHQEAVAAARDLEASCPAKAHWRCQRAVRNSRKLLSGELAPRSFFW